ncbi:MAG: hypothetical protein OYH77_04940 [Pseudomonadota bacterium]|nr:hypothetical protein [Pseudomonadota bacterium]
MLRVVLLKVFLLGVVSCQTTSHTFLPQSILKRYFLPCGNSGGVSFRLHYRANYLFSGFIDWDSEFGIQVTSPIGAPIAAIEHGKKSFINLPNKYISIAIDDRQRIIIDGRDVGMNLQEALCVLEGYLHRDWHSDTVHQNESGDFVMRHRSYGRDIHLTVGFDEFRVKFTKRFLWFSLGKYTVGSFADGRGFFDGYGFRLNWNKS